MISNDSALERRYCDTDKFKAELVRGKFDRADCPLGVHEHGSFDPSRGIVVLCAVGL